MKQLTFDAGPEGREGPLWLSGGKHIPGRGKESAKALRQECAWCFLLEGEQGGQCDSVRSARRRDESSEREQVGQVL